MGTTNSQMIKPKEARKLLQKAKKEAEKKGLQSVAYKFYDPKGKK